MHHKRRFSAHSVEFAMSDRASDKNHRTHFDAAVVHRFRTHERYAGCAVVQAFLVDTPHF